MAACRWDANLSVTDHSVSPLPQESGGLAVPRGGRIHNEGRFGGKHPHQNLCVVFVAFC